MSSLSSNAGFPRSDTSILTRWWWTIDRWQLSALLLLLATGVLLALAASPPVAERIGLDNFHFFRRQLVFAPLAALVLLVMSLLSPTGVRRVSILVFLAGFAALLLTLFMGDDIKGAQRWLYVAGLSIQPSEFIKPAFAVVMAWLIAGQIREPEFPGRWLGTGLLVAICAVLVMQPDMGQTLLVFAVWSTQLFLAGASMWTGALLLATGVASLLTAYFFLPHFASRIDRFIDPSGGDHYQIDAALNAFRAGGFFGQGPGEGLVKHNLPDAHTDFIFAVMGEEFGLIACAGLVLVFAFIVFRGFAHLLEETDAFVVLAVGGLLTQFGLQALINISVNLDLMPAKGMTLPFVSYGGSSLLGMAFGMGALLALTRRAAVRRVPYEGRRS